VGIRPKTVITHTVRVLAPGGSKARIETFRRLRDRTYANVIGQCAIEALGIDILWPRSNIDMCNLPACVDPSIGAPGAHDLNRLLEQVTQNAFHFALHGAEPKGFRLSSPPVEVTAVVRDLQT
jgi:hypothetical protein